MSRLFRARAPVTGRSFVPAIRCSIELRPSPLRVLLQITCHSAAKLTVTCRRYENVDAGALETTNALVPRVLHGR